jgi:cytosine/uracil/thiamine/allantoin permease
VAADRDGVVGVTAAVVAAAFFGSILGVLAVAAWVTRRRNRGQSSEAAVYEDLARYAQERLPV